MVAEWDGDPKQWVNEAIPFATLNKELPNRLEFLKQLVNDDGTPNFFHADVVATDFSKTSDVALTNVPGLSFDVKANETWFFYVALLFRAAAAGDLKLDLTVPSLAVGRHGAHASRNEPSVSTAAVGTPVNVPGNDANDISATYHGTVRNGANAGTVQVQAAQNTSNVTPSIIRADTFIAAFRKIG